MGLVLEHCSGDVDAAHALVHSILCATLLNELLKLMDVLCLN